MKLNWRREMDSNHHEHPTPKCEWVSTLPRHGSIVGKACLKLMTFNWPNEGPQALTVQSIDIRDLADDGFLIAAELKAQKEKATHNTPR